MMEPKILMIGRKLEVVNILIDELDNFGRDVIGANEKEQIAIHLANYNIDFVVIGAGLSESEKEDFANYITSIHPKLGVYTITQTESSTPYDMIDFTNRLAVNWKVGHSAILELDEELLN